MATKSKVKKAATIVKRTKLDDKATIKVIGEHSRRKGSRFFGGYEAMRKTRTVGAFRALRAKMKFKDATQLLTNAVKDKYVAIRAA